MFFMRLVDLKNDKVKFKITPQTNEQNLSVVFGCIRFINSCSFLSNCLDETVKNLDNDDFVTLKEEFPDKWQISQQKLGIPL